jgi:hypothetical protein
VLIFFSSDDPQFQALMVIYVLSLATMAQYFASPSNRRADGSDMLNSIELFSLLVGILMLVGGLGMTSTNILLEPLREVVSPSQSITGEMDDLHIFYIADMSVMILTGSPLLLYTQPIILCSSSF